MSGDGGPAFPTERSQMVLDQAAAYGQPLPRMTSGMSLRDYFAAKAMQSLLQRSGVLGTNNYQHSIAADAYDIADAMLKAKDQA